MDTSNELKKPTVEQLAEIEAFALTIFRLSYPDRESWYEALPDVDAEPLAAQARNLLFEVKGCRDFVARNDMAGAVHCALRAGRLYERLRSRPLP